MYRLLLVVFSLSVLFSSCKSSDTEKITVASQFGDCIGVVPMKCLLIKKSGDIDWEFLYTQIEGFNYEPGYEYVLEIRTEKRENVHADQSSIRYILVKQLSKTKKDSEDLPLIPMAE